MIVYNGSSGSLGAYLSAVLARHRLAGVALRARLEDRSGLRAELAALAPRVARGAPVALVQLAARVSVPSCEQDPDGAAQTNVADTLATVEEFLTWAEAQGAAPRVVYVSTGHVYAAATAPARAGEDHALAPRSVYARTKLAAERALAASALVQRHPLVIARVFGLIAPRQPPHYVLPGLIRRVREERFADIPGLSYHRDYLDARDVCEMLVALTRVGAGVINVCSGAPIQLREMVATILRQLRPADAERLLAGLTEAPGRADDVPWIVGDPARLTALVGAAPRATPLDATVRDALALWQGG